MFATTTAAQTGWSADAGLVPMRLSKVHQKKSSSAGAALPGASWSQALAFAGQQQEDERARLDALMRSYRRGMVRKAQALKVAVERGLQPPLN